ncbi:MAG: glycosyltransferase family 2 protein [Myxococcales bacterium]|nr:glycosyltransferase family 2 protein [Myxococcales bacterium]
MHDERDSLERLVAELESASVQDHFQTETIIVDDGSADGSAEKLAELSQHHELRILSLSKHYGQTAALSAGFEHAHGDIVVALDADLQNDPQDILALIHELESSELDVVSGWRRPRRDRWSRRVGSRVGNWLAARLSGVPLHDFGCTLKAYRRECLKPLRMAGDMHRFIPIYLAWNGARVGELTVNHRPRSTGRSKYGIGRIPRVVLDLIAMPYLRPGARSVGRTLGGFGLLATTLGVVCAGIGLGFFGNERIALWSWIGVLSSLSGALTLVAAWHVGAALERHRNRAALPLYTLAGEAPQERDGSDSRCAE